MKTRHIVGYSVVMVFIAGTLSFLLVSKTAAQSTTVKSTQGPVRIGDKDPASLPTPRLSDGHPDLTGFWAGGAPPDEDPVGKSLAANPNATVHELTKTADGSFFFSYAGANGGVGAVEDRVGDNTPKIVAPYKTEYAAKAQEIIAAQNGWGGPNILDPNLDCKPAGVPRASFGGFVVANPKAIVLAYEALPGPYYRIIYLDGRPHPTDYDTSYMGHSTGRWEGDTLVIDTVGLDETTWLQGPGASIHSDQERVTERWTRKGNQVTIETTVEDPIMFSKPWVMPKRTVNLTSGDPSLYGNYILPAMCHNLDKAHFRVQDSKQICNWCNPESVYGGDPNKLTVPKENRSRAAVTE